MLLILAYSSFFFFNFFLPVALVACQYCLFSQRTNFFLQWFCVLFFFAVFYLFILLFWLFSLFPVFCCIWNYFAVVFLVPSDVYLACIFVVFLVSWCKQLQYIYFLTRPWWYPTNFGMWCLSFHWFQEIFYFFNFFPNPLFIHKQVVYLPRLYKFPWVFWLIDL